MIEAELYQFQKDLKNGLTISEALEKHNLTFKYVCDNLPRAYCSTSRKRGHSKRNSKSRQYITHQERDDRYYLRKSIEGRMVHFGAYKTITDAVKIREYCKKHGWRKECIPEYEKRCGIKR